MPTDLYTKAILTIIASALVVLAWQGTLPPANAQMGTGCGDVLRPCYIAPNFGSMPVEVTNWPPRY